VCNSYRLISRSVHGELSCLLYTFRLHVTLRARALISSTWSAWSIAVSRIFTESSFRTADFQCLPFFEGRATSNSPENLALPATRNRSGQISLFGRWLICEGTQMKETAGHRVTLFPRKRANHRVCVPASVCACARNGARVCALLDTRDGRFVCMCARICTCMCVCT